MELKKINNPANKIFEDRKSIRTYDPAIKINREELTNILQDALTAPSSLNLQPWRFVVIDSPKGKKLIEPYMAFNTLQWQTSAAIIAVFADIKNEDSLEKVLSANVQFGLSDEVTKAKTKERITSYRSALSPERIIQSSLLDCGFVSMQLMLSAKAYGYDTCPIGGYDRPELTKAVGLDIERYFPVILISIGKAAESGKNSVRLSADEVTQWL